jgi:hypothetical protein
MKSRIGFFASTFRVKIVVVSRLKTGPLDPNMRLVESHCERLVQHGRFEPPDRSNSPAWPDPVVANGKPYLRDRALLLCCDAPADKGDGPLWTRRFNAGLQFIDTYR